MKTAYRSINNCSLEVTLQPVVVVEGWRNGGNGDSARGAATLGLCSLGVCCSPPFLRSR